MGQSTIYLFSILELMKLIAKMLVVLSPVLICVGFLTGMLFYIGEFTSIKDVATQQLDNHEIVFSADEVFSPYKWHMVQRRSPKLLIIGSSRVMSFRSQFFHLDEENVYNAGMSLGNIWRVMWVLDQLKAQSKLPETLIVGLDQDWFAPGRSSPDDIDDIDIPAPSFTAPNIEMLFNRIRYVVGDIVENQYQLTDILDRRDPFYDALTIGYNGITRTTGFRWDGSRVLNPSSLNILPDENRFFNTRERMTVGSGRLTYSDDPTAQSLAVVQLLIDFCLENDIDLIAFMPPFPPTIYQEMQATDNYDYIPKTANQLNTMFADTDFLFFDFTDGKLPNVGDEHYLDGTHGSEFVYLNLYLEMLKQADTVLGVYSDYDYLQSYALQPSDRSQYEVFGVNQ